MTPDNEMVERPTSTLYVTDAERTELRRLAAESDVVSDLLARHDDLAAKFARDSAQRLAYHQGTD